MICCLVRPGDTIIYEGFFAEEDPLRDGRDTRRTWRPSAINRLPLCYLAMGGQSGNDGLVTIAKLKESIAKLSSI